MKIAVNCAYDKMTRVSALKPNPMDPNTHPEWQIELLAEILKETGWRVPITVSNRSGFIVRGHGRLMAAKALGARTVPVDFQDYETEADEMADLVGDNKIQELSCLDDEKMKALFPKIKDQSKWVMTAFDRDEIDRLMVDHSGFLNGILGEDGGGGEGSGESGNAENGGGEDPGPGGAPQDKFFKLPIEFTHEDRDFIAGVVSQYQEAKGILLSSDALFRMCVEWEESHA